MDNCIGKANYLYYFVFIVFLEINNVLNITAFALIINYSYRCNSLWEKYVVFSLALVIFVISTVILIPIGRLIWTHINNILQDRTTYERRAIRTLPKILSS